MSFRKLGKILGKIMILEGLLMFFPLLIALIYQENFINVLAFAIPIIALIVLGIGLQLPKPDNRPIYQKEAFALVALVWIVMALFGAVPFVVNGDIPNYIDAFFEIMSGFTTTGASIITDLSVISHSSLFWRSFSHWIGGMGVLVFILIFIPESNEGSSMYLLRAESPGPQVGKLVSKMKVTTRILYLIYLTLTVLEVILLNFDKPLAGYENDKFFFSLLTAFGSAGTGGFGFVNGSMQLCSPYSQYVIATFLLLFGCNFGLYYMILIGKAREIVKSQELKAYLLIILTAISVIFISLIVNVGSLAVNYTTQEAFRHAYFQVASIFTTTGFSTTDFNLWPQSARSILVVLMFIGGMAGSTGGGMKVSRIVIAVKGIMINVRKLINPRYVPKTKFEGKILEEETYNGVFTFITIYLFIILAVTILLSLDPVNGQTITIVSDAGSYSVTHGFESNLTSALSCISNIGPGLGTIGAYGSFAMYNSFSKILLAFTMLIGRLEILPVLILFTPRTWSKT